jgi:hypothetical protein
MLLFLPLRPNGLEGYCRHVRCPSVQYLDSVESNQFWVCVLGVSSGRFLSKISMFRFSILPPRPPSWNWFNRRFQGEWLIESNQFRLCVLGVSRVRFLLKIGVFRFSIWPPWPPSWNWFPSLIWRMPGLTVQIFFWLIGGGGCRGIKFAFNVGSCRWSSADAHSRWQPSWIWFPSIIWQTPQSTGHIFLGWGVLLALRCYLFVLHRLFSIPKMAIYPYKI